MGEPFPDVPQTAMFLSLLEGQGLLPALEAGAREFLREHQALDGSWEQSVYKTALALSALAPYALPDPLVDETAIYTEPAAPYDGESVTLHAAVHNGGADLPAGTPFEWRILDEVTGNTIAALPAIRS